MRLDNKGQASAELIFVTLIFLVIAAGFVQLTSSEMNKADTGNLGQARMIGESAAETINTVYMNGNGYSANLTLPQLSNSISNGYTVYVYSTGNLNVIYHGNNITIKLIPTNITNFNMNSGTTYLVSNNNNTITFT